MQALELLTGKHEHSFVNRHGSALQFETLKVGINQVEAVDSGLVENIKN